MSLANTAVKKKSQQTSFEVTVAYMYGVNQYVIM